MTIRVWERRKQKDWEKEKYEHAFLWWVSSSGGMLLRERACVCLQKEDPVKRIRAHGGCLGTDRRSRAW